MKDLIRNIIDSIQQGEDDMEKAIKTLENGYDYSGGYYCGKRSGLRQVRMQLQELLDPPGPCNAKVFGQTCSRDKDHTGMHHDQRSGYCWW